MIKLGFGISAITLTGASLLLLQPAIADEIESQSTEQQSAATTVDDWLMQIAQAGLVEITNVQIEETADGFTLQLDSTATRTDTPILDVPQSIQVVPQEVLEDQQIIRVDDALRNVSGVVGRLNPFGSSTNLTIRGFTTDNFTAGAILRDGFRVNDNLGTQETANIE